MMDLYLWEMNQRSFDLLRQGGHFETLTKIDLTARFRIEEQQGLLVDDAESIASEWIIEVLESCPSLEHIMAKEIRGQHIIDSKPWVCHRLKKFEVLIRMELPEQSTTRVLYTENKKRQCHQVFERLSQLRQLKVLNISNLRLTRYGHVAPVTFPLDLRLGLGHLSTLKDLEWIGYQGHQNMRMAEVEWMLQHWRRLRKITGGRPSMKDSKTFGNMNVRCHLIMQALDVRKVEIPKEWRIVSTIVKQYMKSKGLEDVYDTDDDDEGEKE
jgi:hypothetical protein